MRDIWKLQRLEVVDSDCVEILTIAKVPLDPICFY